MPDHENIQHQQVLLNTHRKNAIQLSQQAALYVQAVPIHIVNQLQHERAQIQHIKQALREWGVAVDDQPIDTQPSPESEEQAQVTPLRPSQDEIAQLMLKKRIVALATVGAVFGGAYMTGGWYKGAYFGAFNLPNELHGFSPLYYLHASWATIAVAIAGLLLAGSILLTLSVTRHWLGYLYTTSMLIAMIVIIGFWPFRFNPTVSPIEQFLGSRDYCIIALAIFAFAPLLFPEWRAKTSSLVRAATIDYWKHPYIIFLLCCIVALGYLAGLAQVMGRYHGQAAIWEGKMNVRWAKAAGEWWIFVATTDDGRYILYQRERSISKLFSQQDIEEFDGPVTAEPKNVLPP
jgi:hypothetical protein